MVTRSLATRATKIKRAASTKTKKTALAINKKKSESSASTHTNTRVAVAKAPTKKSSPITVSKKLITPPKTLAAKSPLAASARHPLGHLLIEKILREGGFKGEVSTDPDLLRAYSVDESIFSIRPQMVIQPKNAEDIEHAVTVLAKETLRFSSISLTPRAAGTGLSGGSLTDSIVIDVSAHMRHIGKPQLKGDKTTITVEPGAMWKDVEAILKKEKLYLPSYPASKDICSIGGAVANNAAGPDSLRHGHTAQWVESLDVVLHDGNTYTIKPITFKEYKVLSQKSNAYGKILSDTFSLLERNEKKILAARPKTQKNTAGYALWDVVDTSVAQFKKGKGHLDMTRLISGSQGTIGIISSITLRTEPIKLNTHLITVPVFDLSDAAEIIKTALKFNPVNIELFDGFTYDLALKNPQFFKSRLEGLLYYRVMLSMYTTYHIRYQKKMPEFILLVTIDLEEANESSIQEIVDALQKHRGKRARHVTNPIEREMFWQIRRASYSLSKFQDPNKRPAAFLEDITVPPEQLGKFFVEIKKLLNKYHLTAAVHGHGGNGHLHFYPLIDFTQKTTPTLITKMADEFFATAVKLKGNICGEHNDGIIRTPHLSKMFSKDILQLFSEIEHIFDPNDIFNPGKKVNPRFDIKSVIRKVN